MRKIALLTINGNYNFGNKLQHYALQKYIKKMGFQTETIYCYQSKKFIEKTKKMIKFIVKPRYRKFAKFDRLIKYSKSYVYNNILYNEIDYPYYIIGSDQVWNVNFPFFSKEYVLYNIKSNNKISYASSFGVSNIPEEYHNLFSKNLSDFKAISVREEQGKEIINQLTKRDDIEVLIDPTMLLTGEEWDEHIHMPNQLNKIKEKKYILNYFLGNLSDKRKKEIKKIAEENNCHIINILDENDPFYSCGPSEFLYLEKNAFLICTDSFHSSVFAIIYNRPFIIFDRDDSNKNMNSRIDTLINKFKLKNRKFNGEKITEENLNHDYTEAYKILEIEREKSKKYLEKALDIEEKQK